MEDIEEIGGLDSSDEAVKIIALESERKFWENEIIPHYIYKPEKCPYCNAKNISIGN